MTAIANSILPSEHVIAKIKHEANLDLQAICVFVATGFFMDDDTFWKNQKCLLPAHDHLLDDDGFLIDSKPNFKWHYTPRDINFNEAVDEYIDLLTTIIKDQVGDNPVILPLSGGLDSRSQAMVIKDLDNPVQSYSYHFDGGYPEHKISAKIASICGFKFKSLTIPKSYLWNCIDELAHINDCYSEFSHARQMAVLPQLKQMQGVISLGHWGDVLFDRGAPEGILEKDTVPLLMKKMLKPGGFYLAEQLWKYWKLDGNFEDYFIARIETALSKIKIDNLSAKVRAFKTSQWAHRWTTTNLSIFREANPITMPYYENSMCQFICTVPEEYLADRRMQIAHLKRNKALSDITWHAQKPFNINNFNYNRTPYNLPYRIVSKLKREGNALLGNPFIQRNYELQFLGKENDRELQERLFLKSFSEFIPNFITEDIYTKFSTEDNVYYSHPTSMLLTLSLWDKHFNGNG